MSVLSASPEKEQNAWQVCPEWTRSRTYTAMLNLLSKQLIQQAKVFQAVIRLGTYPEL